MILDRLIKLDERKRISAAVLVVLIAVCVCYFAITRESVIELQNAKADYAGIQTSYASTENQQAEFLNLQKQLDEKEKQLQEHQQQCFSGIQASKFFENLDAKALACNLKPVSRTISEPKEFASGKEQELLKTQSAKIIIAGSYFDIIDFISELVDRPQKVGITNLYIALPTGEEFHPKASFEIILFIDPYKDIRK